MRMPAIAPTAMPAFAPEESPELLLFEGSVCAFDVVGWFAAFVPDTALLAGVEVPEATD
jgi:hypothetical protein